MPGRTRKVKSRPGLYVRFWLRSGHFAARLLRKVVRHDPTRAHVTVLGWCGCCWRRDDRRVCGRRCAGLGQVYRPPHLPCPVRAMSSQGGQDRTYRSVLQSESEERHYFFATFPGTLFFTALPFPSSSSACRTFLNSLNSALSTFGNCRSSLSSALTMVEPITT